MLRLYVNARDHYVNSYYSTVPRRWCLLRIHVNLKLILHRANIYAFLFLLFFSLVPRAGCALITIIIIMCQRRRPSVISGQATVCHRPIYPMRTRPDSSSSYFFLCRHLDLLTLRARGVNIFQNANTCCTIRTCVRMCARVRVCLVI